MEIPVHNTEGNVVTQMNFKDDVYAVEVNVDLVHQAMVYHQANQRQGTHSTKRRGEVSGGGSKPFAQKHTGRARMGTIRSPLARSGGVVFGPHPRSYKKQLPKKMRRQAIRCVLSSKVSEGRLVVLEDFGSTNGKTRAMKATLEALAVSTPALVVVPSPQRDISLSVRNIPRVKTLVADLLNVLDLVRYDKVVMTVDAARRVEELWSPNSERSGTEGRKD